MSAPPVELPPSHSTSGHQDGLGRRTLCFDREDGLILERLHVRPELGAFEAALRERMTSAAGFEDERFARVRSIERDPGGGLTVVSEFVAGNRVCDLLEAASDLAAEEATSLSVDAALGFLLEILPALAALHSIAGFAHGAVGPDRTVLTPAGEVVLLDTVFGHTLERLQFNRRRLWQELRIATLPAAGPARFDVAADLGQASLTALMIVIGRPLKDTEYPDGLTALVTEVVEIAQIRGSARFASGLQHFLERTLPLPGRKPYASADEAAIELRQLAREIGIERCHTALVGFISDMNRNLAAIEIAAAANRSAPGATFGHDAIGELAELMDDSELEAEPEFEPAPETFDELTITSAPDDASAALGLELAPEDLPVIEPEAAAFEAVAAEELAAEEEAAPAVRYEYETIEVFAAIEPEAPEPIVFEPGATPEFTPEPILEIEPEAILAAEPEDGPVLAEIELVRARFALEANRVAEPTIAFDESFPDPRVQPLPDGPLLTLQQETAAWRAAFVAADAAAQSAPPDPVPAPEAPAVISARKRKRGTKDRDKLRSNAPTRPAPLIVPQPEIPMPVTIAPPLRMPTPLYVPPASAAYGSGESTYGRSEQPRPDPSLLQVRPAPVPAPVAPAAPSIGLRVKTELPSGYKPVPTRPVRYSDEPVVITALPYAQRSAAERTSSFSWKPAAAAAVLIVAAGAGITYWPSRANRPAAVVTPAPTKAPAAAAAILAAGATGSIVITTQPPGARVLLDGNPIGESPLVLNTVAVGRHTLTFTTSSTSVKKTVRVESGKTLALDVSVYSGWVAVFAPIALDIAENGRAIGSTEQGRVILSPGRHELTLSNREFGYSALQVVEVEAGEERSINVTPMGELNLNSEPWAEVWIDGKKVGDTPMAGHPVPLGTHEIVFKHAQLGERRVTAVVTATKPVPVTVDFRKPS